MILLLIIAAIAVAAFFYVRWRNKPVATVPVDAPVSAEVKGQDIDIKAS